MGWFSGFWEGGGGWRNPGADPGGSDAKGFIKRIMKQTAVYWATAEPDAFGQATFADPIEIACRWESGTFQRIGSDGAVTAYKTKAIVDRDLVINGILWLGTLLTVPSANPENVAGSLRIVDFTKTPDLRAKNTIREAALA